MSSRAMAEVILLVLVSGGTALLLNAIGFNRLRLAPDRRCWPKALGVLRSSRQRQRARPVQLAVTRDIYRHVLASPHPDAGGKVAGLVLGPWSFEEDPVRSRVVNVRRFDAHRIAQIDGSDALTGESTDGCGKANPTSRPAAALCGGRHGLASKLPRPVPCRGVGAGEETAPVVGLRHRSEQSAIDETADRRLDVGDGRQP